MQRLFGAAGGALASGGVAWRRRVGRLLHEHRRRVRAAHGGGVGALGSEVDHAVCVHEAAAQLALLRACTEPVHNPALHIIPGSAECMVSSLQAWLAARNLSFPLPAEAFYDHLWPFLREQPE